MGVEFYFLKADTSTPSSVERPWNERENDVQLPEESRIAQNKELEPSVRVEDMFEQMQTTSDSTVMTELLQKTQGIHLLLPFFGGMLVMLLLVMVVAVLHRRKRKVRPHPVSKPSSSVITTAYIHEQGARESQQDAFGITGEDAPAQGVLAAVADGMGGLVNSGQVSNGLIEGMMEAYAPSNEIPPARQLQILFMQALGRVEEIMKSSTTQSGSTLVACLVKDDQLSWLSVGDSHIYLWRNGGLIQLNQDHDFYHDLTLLAMQGDMKLSEADSNPRRENLTSYIGRGFPRKVEWNQEPIQLMVGDKVLLVSDGVYRALSQAEIADYLTGELQNAAQAIRTAIHKKRHPQQDNYTAVILEI